MPNSVYRAVSAIVGEDESDEVIRDRLSRVIASVLLIWSGKSLDQAHVFLDRVVTDTKEMLKTWGEVNGSP